MSPEKWGCYSYSVAEKRALISWGMLTAEAILYFTGPRDRSPSFRSTPHGDVLYMGDLPAGAASLEALVPAVDKAIAEMGRPPRHPAHIVFPGLSSGKSAQEPTTELRIAAESLLPMLEREKETLSILYGYALPKLGAWFSESNWGGQFCGIRLANDSHIYDLRADLGRLDLIQCDPTSGKWLDRIDVRSWEVIRTANANPEIGDVQICRQKMDLEPFIRELQKLVQFLKDAAGKMVTIERIETTGDESSNLSESLH